MKATELRTKSQEELTTLLSSQRREQFKLRLLKSGGEFKKTNQFKMIRRTIARILTLLSEMNREKGKTS